MERCTLLVVLLAVTLVHALPKFKDGKPDLDSYIESLSKQERQVLTRVIGGEEIAQGEWPWLVSLQGEIPTKTFFGITISSANLYCGASLLNDEWILTAAHCFVADDMSKAKEAKYWTAKLGDIDIETGIIESVISWFVDIFTDPLVWEIEGEKIFIHPDYDGDNYWLNDIALMKLEEKVPSSADDNSDIQAVTLPSQGQSSFPEDNQMCVMKGWGCTEAGGSVADVAMAIEIPKVSDSSCKSIWGSSLDMTSRMCAGENLEDIGICPGDSGGPLVAKNDDDVYVQVGIASFTSSNSPGNYPGVFTRVSNYVTWIESVIQNN